MQWLKHNKWVVIVFPIVVIVALSAALSRRTVIPVRAETTTRETLTNTISTNGKAEPVDNFEAHAAAPGTVKKVHVKSGQTVKAGQLLLEMDSADARAQSARALAQL